MTAAELDLDGILTDIQAHAAELPENVVDCVGCHIAVTDVPALVAELRLYKPLAWPTGEALYAHTCNNVEWWHEATQGPINEQGCDACESGPYPGGWQPVYVRRADR